METTFQKPNITACKVLSVGHLTVDTYAGFLTPILPFIAAKLGISIAVISFLLSISHLFSSMLQPFFGYISDSLSKRFFVFWGIIFAAFFISMTGVVPNVWLLGLCIIFGNMGGAFYHPQATSLTAQYSGNEINKIMGIYTACGTIGYAFGPVISSLLVGKFGLGATPFAMLWGVIFAFILYVFLPKIPKKVVNKEKINFFAIVKAIFKNKILSILTWFAIINAMITLSIVIWMPFLWKDQGYLVSTIGIIIALYSVFGGIGSFVGGRVADIVGRRNVYYLSLLPIMPLTLMFLYFSDKIPYLSFILFSVTGFFTMFSISMNMVLAQKCMPESKGMISGVVGGFSWGVMGIFLTPLGYLAQKYGIANIIAIISAIPLFSSLLVKQIPDEITG